MRKFHYLLVCPWLALAGKASATTLFEARGFKNGHCYQEIAKIRCKEECGLSVFPDSPE